MIQSRTWKRGAALVGLLAGSAAFAQPVGYDFNDDGYSDYPVSIISYDDTNPGVGAARIWSGASKSVIQTIESSDTNTLYGWSTGSAGDLNGDGKADLIVGEPLWSAASNFEGRLHVLSGADGSTLLTISGPYVDAGIGRYVTGIGDWNGDGTNDIVSSGWDIADTNGDGVGDDPIGMVFVFSGVDGSLLTEIIDVTATEGFGYSVFGLGDITNDGLADIAVVDRRAEPVQGTGIFGEMYIFTGSTTATLYDITNAHRTISNTDSTIRGFASQVDVMHPDLWHDEPTIQVINLTDQGSDGVNGAEIDIEILKVNGVNTGTKGTRNSLQLAGDINLDGVVDALDIQDSISQLGTNPQAIGVMPIADSNGDSIIDLVDIEVVVDGYGQSTDIYEGLWDGTRLLSVAAANAGFGSTGGITGGGMFGGTDFRPGRRPADDCPPVIIAPAHLTASIVPTLLRSDSRVNCNSCPGPNEPDPNGCWVCDDHGSLSGGTVTANPAQPGPGETFVFTASGVTDSGGTKKCECASAENRMVPPGQPSYSWVVVTRNADGSWPEPDSIPSSAWAPGNTTTPITGNACEEFKAYFSTSVNRECPPDNHIIEGYAETSSFTLTSETILEAPEGSSDRTRLGLREVVRVEVVEPGVSVTWEVEGGTRLASSSTHVNVRAGPRPGSIVVRAIASDDCERTRSFQVIEPNGVELSSADDYYHVQGYASAGVRTCIRVLPLDASFEHISIGEGTSAPPVKTGEFLQVANAFPGSPWNQGHGAWFLPVNENNRASNADEAWTGFDAPIGAWNAGTLTWTIDWNYKVGTIVGGPVDTTVSITTVTGTGAMMIDKTTNNSPTFTSPLFDLNDATDPWDPNANDCSN